MKLYVNSPVDSSSIQKMYRTTDHRKTHELPQESKGKCPKGQIRLCVGEKVDHRAMTEFCHTKMLTWSALDPSSCFQSNNLDHQTQEPGFCAPVKSLQEKTLKKLFSQSRETYYPSGTLPWANR